MDPISASTYSLHASCYSLYHENDEQKPRRKLGETAASCRSLSHYENRNFKCLIPQILATAISASFNIVVGIALGYSAILIPQLEDKNSDLQVTQTESSWIASIIVVVVPIGAILGGFIMDAVGRLNTIKLCAIPVVTGWILTATATNVHMLLISRVLIGIGAAWGTSPAVVYITEIARPDMRGSLISSAPAYSSLGMVLAYIKGWFMTWRTVAWVCNIYTVLPAILVMFIPESPVWLVSKGRIDQARKSLEWINKYQPQPADKKETLAEMQLEFLINDKIKKDNELALKEDESAAKKMAKGFAQPTGYKPTLILIGLFVFQQFSGIYITLFYSITFFEEMGAEIDPYLASILIGIVRFLMSMINTYMLKRFRRRPLVAISCAGMAVSMFFSGLYTLWIKEGKTTQSWIPVAFLLLYVLTSMIGMLPIPWTMTAELFPLEIRGMAHSISCSVANVITFAALQSYRPLEAALGGSFGIQWFFAGVSIAGAVYSFFFLPETHGKKLNDIQEYFVYNTIALNVRTKTESEQKSVVKNRAESDDFNSSQNQTEELLSGKQIQITQYSDFNSGINQTGELLSEKQTKITQYYDYNSESNQSELLSEKSTKNTQFSLSVTNKTS